MRNWILGGIVVLAFLLRVVGLASYPTGFTPDEASFGYDAYSLLKTGRDQWGESWPLTFRSFGDFKLPLYTYLTIPSVAIFGLNEFAVRLPNAVFGTLAVLVVYLFTGELVRIMRPVSLLPRPTSSIPEGVRRGSPSARHPLSFLSVSFHPLAVISALLLAISPWHISLSRGAFEANLTTFFLPLGVWAFLRGIARPRWMVLASFAFGLNLFTYHSARLFTLLLLGVLIFWKRKELGINTTTLRSVVVNYRLSVLLFAVFMVVAGYTMFAGAGERGADVAIFNPTDKWAAVSDRRYEAVLQGLPDAAARVFSNKAVYVFDRFVGGYFSYLSPRFLFVEGAGEWTYGMIAGRGVLYLIELPLVLAALGVFVLRRDLKWLAFIVAWVLLSPIPAALAKGPGYAANRAAVMMPAIQVLSAYGVLVLYDIARKKWRVGWLRWVAVVVLLISLVIFLEDYRYHAPVGGGESMHFGKREAVEYVRAIEGEYEKVVFSRSLSEPHIWVAFYNKWDPADYQRQSPDWLRYKQEGRAFVDQLGQYALGKYTFRSINFDADKYIDGILLVGRSNEFPFGVNTVKTIDYPNGDPAILIVDPRDI